MPAPQLTRLPADTPLPDAALNFGLVVHGDRVVITAIASSFASGREERVRLFLPPMQLAMAMVALSAVADQAQAEQAALDAAGLSRQVLDRATASVRGAAHAR